MHILGGTNMNQKKLMILGASQLQLPAIIRAKEMGLYVIVIDKDKNAVGANYANEFYEISTIDIEKIINKAEELKIDGIMTLATDMPMRSVAAVANKLNLIGITKDTALKATDKALMRDCLKKNNVPVPHFFKVNSLKEYNKAVSKIKNKFIVKPTDSSGSRGVFLIDDINDKKSIEDAFEYSKKHTKSGELLVEEFMEGPEVSVETLSVEGNVHIIAITDKFTTGAPRFIEMGHSQPSILSEDIQNKVKVIAIDAVNALGIKYGAAHTEIIITNDGPKIVEIGARLGGDYITTHLTPLSTGIDIVGCCIKIALGEKIELTSKIVNAAAIRYFESRPGKIISIRNITKANKINGVVQISFDKKPEDYIDEIKSSSDRIGFVISKDETLEGAIKICDLVFSTIEIEIDENLGEKPNE